MPCTASPSCTAPELADARIVGNPGCYPTATLLALAPLAREELIADVVIDAKQGISGAGRSFDERTHLSLAGENIAPYSVTGHRHTPEIEEQLALVGYEGRVLFQAHLAPLDQGELVSCYVEPTREIGDEELADIYSRAYAGRAVRRSRRRAARHARRARDELLPDPRCAAPAHRPGDRLRGDGQPLEGHQLAGDPEPEPDVRPAGGGGPAVSFFASRWVTPPDGVRELPLDTALPAGFRAAGAVAGLKPSGKPDVALLICDSTPRSARCA